MQVKKEAAEESKDFLKWFSELNKSSGRFAGGKGANLAEIYNLGVPVPPGFVITAQAYDYFIKKAGLNDKIKTLLEKINYEDTAKLDEITKEVRELIENSRLPAEMEEEILEAYKVLGTEDNEAKEQADHFLEDSSKNIFVAVRSSATMEDLESVSENEHVLLKIKGNMVYDKIKNIYAGFGDCADYKVEVPSMNGNKVEWMPIKKLLKHPTTKSTLYKIKTITGREITISPNHTLISLDETNLQPIVTNITKIRKGSKIPVIGLIPEINNENPIITSDYVKVENVTGKDNKIMIKNKRQK